MTHLDTLESWLKSLPDDIKVFSDILSDERASASDRKTAAGIINYLFKSVDLIPDGIDDIGYMDDVLTLRIGAGLIEPRELERANADLAERIRAFKEDIPVIREILGEDIFERFLKYTGFLPENSSRGRSAAEIVSRPDKLSDTRMEVHTFCKEFKTPDFEKNERTLTKLRSFLDTRLPR